ncbi:hypothetical protein FOY32_07015 [Corynebacterium glutamicum]|nr:hypothetical protein FOL53_02385 [Corynebacterium glutamicum]QDQ24728.1 hypothetical protein FOY32_07015 [Corynebacterium glutamicum]
MSPVASAQSERVVPPEERDAYVTEFQYNAATPSVVDGVGGLTDEEVAEIQETIRQAEASGPPQDEIIPGEMWSDKVGVPEGFDKAEADQSEVAIAKETSQSQARGFQTTAERCRSFWLIPYKVCGEILDRYEQLGGQNSWLLLPIEHQAGNPDGQGHRERFVGGAIYQHPDTGAHAVSPMTMSLWQRHGWEAGWLGYPIGGEVPVEGSSTIEGETSGWVQHFQGGRVYRTPILEGFQVASINGLILDKWLELGGPDSSLGFPVADEAKTQDGQGKFSTFQGGSIYWHPNHGAHEVAAPILQLWQAAGAETSEWGYPVAPPEVSPEGYISQEFEGGVLDITDLFEASGSTYLAGKEISTVVYDYLVAYSQSVGIDLEAELGQSGPLSLNEMALLADDDPSNSDRGGVEVPGYYEYDINLEPKGRHDYCTWSADQFPAPGVNADFSGACAIHDLCMDRADATGNGYNPCNTELKMNMDSICRTVYSGFDVRRQSCLNTAVTYWHGVTWSHANNL